ncbi:hypothetical protein JOQ06_030391, partial [Pogonophryne albipinna]
MLRDLLKLDEKPLLDRAHRTLRERPKEGTLPRPFVVRVHFFHIRSQILQHAGESSPLLYNGKRISIFPDYTSSVAKKRAAFVPVKRTLHSYPNVKFGLLFPATLKITMPNGTSHRFEDPTVATDFVNKNCGDFNCWLSPQLDRSSKKTVTPSGSAKTIRDFMSEFAITDPWRFFNPT